jgi:hypothetical protein
MKIIFVFFFIVIASQAKADVDFVPLNMELGYWEITTQINLNEMLANIPEEQRAMMRQMMKGTMKMPVIKQCMTQDTYKNMQVKMMESLESANGDCDLKVLKSTAQEFSGVVTCAGGATIISITTKAVNSKRHESQVSTNAGGMGQNNIKTIGEWKSAKCSDGIE